jgi:predicted DNA binding CopG/RHH family protein
MAVKKQDLTKKPLISKKIKPSKDEQIIAKEAAYARKDATLNMRISSQFLDDIKAAAQAQGFEKYQAWVSLALLDAVNEAKGIKVEKFSG